jgi:hypothetical protein
MTEHKPWCLLSTINHPNAECNCDPLPEPIAAPAITECIHSDVLSKGEICPFCSTLPEPIAAGEECICPKDVVRHGFHQDCPIHGYAQPPIAAGEEDDRPGLGSSATPDRTAFPPIAAGGGEAPGHTDLMVTPESLDAFMEANPLPSPSSSDLVERLLKPAAPIPPEQMLLRCEAADTIQRLEAAVKLQQCDLAALQAEMAEWRLALENIRDGHTFGIKPSEIARAALAGKD